MARKIASSACLFCKRRKIKCDTSHPTCSNCARAKVKCVYNVFADGRRSIHRKSNKELNERLATLETWIAAIRQGGDVAKNAISEIQNTPNDMVYHSESNDIFTLDRQGQLHFYGLTSNMRANNVNLTHKEPVDGMLHGQPHHQQPFELEEVPEHIIEHLLDLYFCWQHTYYNILDKDLFLRDRALGSGPYYSEFLYYAILAHAAMLCDIPELRSDRSDQSTAGFMFFKKAQDSVTKELNSISITTIQGLLLLASREAGNWRNSIGWVYSGMACRMATDLGLHLDCKMLADTGYFSDEEIKARSATFWGCYLFDQGWGLYVGRMPVLRISYVTIEKKAYDPDEKPELWKPVWSLSNKHQLPNDVASDKSVRAVPYYPHNSLTAILKLSEIIEEILTNMSSSGSKMFIESPNTLLLSLDSWKSELPDCLERSSDHPTIIMLLALYNTTKIFLYRRAQGNSEAILHTIQVIVELLERYHSLYSLTMSTNLTVYITFTVATACVELQPEPSEDPAFRKCMDFLDHIGQSWMSAVNIKEQLNSLLLFGNYSNLLDLLDYG